MNRGRDADGKKYGFVRIDGEDVPLTRRGFIVLRIIPIVVLLVVWVLFVGDGPVSS
jgi:hypothetical protein